MDGGAAFFKKLFALLVLAALAGVAYLYWRGRPPGLPKLGVPSRALGSVGEKLAETKTLGSVKAALELHQRLRTQPVEVHADEKGVVTLSGQVSERALKAEAERVAAAVPGVSHVVNELEVDPQLDTHHGSERTLGESLDDKTLEAKVRLAFSLDRELKGTDIEVSAFRREVTLAGEVERASQRALAAEIAGHTADVSGVVNRIQVRGDSARSASGSDTSLSGRAQAAERALAQNSNLQAFGLRVRVREGELVLGGRVRSGAAKELAGILAREAAGRDVRNDVVVEP